MQLPRAVHGSDAFTAWPCGMLEAPGDTFVRQHSTQPGADRQRLGALCGRGRLRPPTKSDSDHSTATFVEKPGGSR